jgi:adenylate cyclase
MNDIFAIQDEIGQAISQALKLQLARPVQAVNIEAWQHCLKGEYYRLKYTPEGLAKAREHFEQAIAIDPNYAHAHARLAGYYYALAFIHMVRLREMANLAKASAEKSLALDPGNIESHSLLAILAGVDHNWKAAADHHVRVLASGWPAGRYGYATYYLLPLGRTAEAVEQSRLALENDPLSMMRHMGVAYTLNFAQRYDESIEVSRRALEIDPSSYFMWHALGMSQFFAGRDEDAIRSLKHTVELAPWYATAIGSLASAYHRAGDQGHAREWAQQLAKSDPDSLAMAEYYATTGDVSAMFEALEGAYVKRDVFLIFIKVWPSFDPYRADMRFQSLLKRMNLA